MSNVAMQSRLESIREVSVRAIVDGRRMLEGKCVFQFRRRSAHGTILLRCADTVPRPYLLHLRGPGVDYSTSDSVSELTMHGMPTGEWVVEVETKAGSHKQSVVVLDGSTHEVMLPNR